jgi:two-component system chemotaxis sensor kinase CheA
MKPEDLHRELMATFQAELAEHCQTLSQGLLALEKNTEPETGAAILAEIFRAAHSLKGAARTVNLMDLSAIAHALEDVLGAVRRGETRLAPDDFDLLLAEVDQLDETLQAHLRGEPLTEIELDEIVTPLKRIGSQALSCPETAQANPSAAGAESEFVPDHPPQPASQPAILPPPLVSPHPATPGPEETIRVATAKLDALMEGVGELLTARMRAEQQVEQLTGISQQVGRWQKRWRQARPLINRLRQSQHTNGDLTPLLELFAQTETELKDLGVGLNGLVSRLANDKNHLQLLTDDLQDGIRRVRLRPVAALFNHFPRLVRDLAREQGKEITVLVEGAETEVDRQVLELLKDPLTHLIRNAVDHGVEPPAARETAGKPRQGIIRLKAEQRDKDIVITLGDDGAGINLNTVRRVAVERGVLSAQEAASLSETETLELIFRADFSTASQVTELSGRGFGLDVVRQNLEQLHGLIQVNTRLGVGTTFRLTLPVTLATTQVLEVLVGGVTVGLPMINVERILRVRLDQIHPVEGKPMIYAEGRALPLISLGEVLGLAASASALPLDARLPIVILGVVDRQVALRVDGLMGAQEVVVKHLGRQLRRVRNVAGAAILGDGRVVVVLNVADLIKSIQAGSFNQAALSIATVPHRQRLLVVDDSITTRTLEKHILENAGYQVQVAANGQEALVLLSQSESEPFDLVVSDIQMPQMDGFSLTEKIKTEARTERVPVVLVTSLESAEDRLKGLNAGADAYITKGAFDQRELLETVERLIG